MVDFVFIVLVLGFNKSLTGLSEHHDGSPPVGLLFKKGE